MVDGLCDVLDEHRAAPRTGREMYPAAIGCVPWLTSERVAERLLALDSFCVVVDKGGVGKPPMVRRELITRGRGMLNAAFIRLEDMVPAANGEPPVIHPYMPREELEHVIEPVRVLGWRQDGQKPLPHPKMLVLGEIGWVQHQTPVGDYEEFRFVPQQVWFGSANWTEAARSHLETGFVCSDPALVREAAYFVTEMIAFSEAVDSEFAAPEPDLVSAPWDDAAFAEAAGELREEPDGWEFDDDE